MITGMRLIYPRIRSEELRGPSADLHNCTRGIVQVKDSRVLFIHLDGDHTNCLDCDNFYPSTQTSDGDCLSTITNVLHINAFRTEEYKIFIVCNWHSKIHQRLLLKNVIIIAYCILHAAFCSEDKCV